MENRTKHTYLTHLYDFIKDIDVECPRCKKHANVNTHGYAIFQREATNVRISCSHCSYFKTLDRLMTNDKHLVIGDAIDPFFHIPLWYKLEMGDHLLWAYNLEHLHFLEQHVGAKLRERNTEKFKVKSIGAKLPRWMTSAKRREEVLKAIGKLKSR